MTVASSFILSSAYSTSQSQKIEDKFRTRIKRLVGELTFEHGGEQWVFDLGDYGTSIFVGSRNGVKNSYRDATLPNFGDYVRPTPNMSDDEIIEECRLKILALVDHETHEFFKRNGRPIHNPHDICGSSWLSYDRRSRMIQEREAACRPPLVPLAEPPKLPEWKGISRGMLMDEAYATYDWSTASAALDPDMLKQAFERATASQSAFVVTSTTA